MAVMLQVKNLSKQFDSLKAVNDLSFTVNEGDVYGFLGQNGAGKSTTIRMLLTLIKPSGGEINIFGQSVLHQRNEVLRQIGAVVERPDLYKYLSAYDNLSIFARLSGIKISRKLIMDQLAMVGLADRSGSKVKTYSQGMKQRLGIAVALVHNPKLIILDEPTNGLDPQGIADMRNLILDLSAHYGKTVIVSSHLLTEIEQIANRMIIIHKGKKITEGVVKDLLDPSHTIVELQTTNDLQTIEKLRNSPWAAFLRDESSGIRLQMNRNDIPAMATWLAERGTGIISVNPKNSLEDYFLSLTNQASYVESVAN
jgi:ABC-type multidrug transport system ATPase subunit